MSKTISGAYANGYTLSNASAGVLNPVTVTGSIAIGTGVIPAALYAQGPAAWSITNLGTITGGGVAGIELAAAGNVVNNQFISGHFGVAVHGGVGNVTNAGTIIALNAGTTETANQAIGVMLSAGGTVSNQLDGFIKGQGAGVEILGGVGSVVNAGTIVGPAYEGIYLTSGTVTNTGTAALVMGGSLGGGGSIGTGGSVVNSGWGVVIRNGGSLFNQGTITGIGQGGALLGSGYANNQGTINGVWGIAINGGSGTVVNSGVLVGTAQSGLYLTGGVVTNTSTGRIAGLTGVVIRGGAGTVVNSGSIGATSPAGYGVYLGAGFSNRLIDNPGAIFSGSVNGGNTVGATATSTLELGVGTQQGTLTGLGTQFVNFGQATLDAGASWALTGVNSIVAGTAFNNLGSLAVNGGLLVNGAMTSSGAVTVASAPGIIGAATITGGGTWTGTAPLVVGGSGAGSFLVAGNGTASAATAVIGASTGGTGEIDVSGATAKFSTNGLLTLGGAGGGRLTVENHATVVTAITGVDLGLVASGAGEVVVTGTNSLFQNNGKFIVGDGGLGGMTIEAGGTVITSPGGALAGAVIANSAGAGGSSVNVVGAASNWQVNGALIVGNAGFGSLAVSQGAAVNASSADLAAAAGGDGVVSVAGNGSMLTLAGSLTVGDRSAGELSILNGATVSALFVTIGNANAASSGNVDVEGAGSRLLIGAGGNLNIGVAGGGSGVLTVGPGSTLTFGGTIVESGHASFNNNGGVIDPDAVEFTTTSNGGTGLNEYDLYVGNIGAVQVSAGTGTWLTPMVLTGTSAADADNNINVNGDTGQWQLSQSGTFVINANTIDAGQAIVFQDATDTLVIGQVVNGGSAGVSGQIPTIAPGAMNMLQAGGFDAQIWGYQAGDNINFNNMIVSSDSIVNGNTLDLFDSSNTLLGSLTFFNKAGNKPLALAGMQAAAAQIVAPCFAAGTLIETARGLRSVESLTVGDEVVTVLGGPGRIVWAGSRSVDCERHPKPETVWPVCIAANAFGDNVPARDLFVSPDHAIYVDGALVPAKLLINGTSVWQVEVPRVVYHHIELEQHDVVLAEGLPAETYLDAGDRARFSGGEVIALYPDFAARAWEMRGCAPLVVTGQPLAAARAKIAA